MAFGAAAHAEASPGEALQKAASDAKEAAVDTAAAALLPRGPIPYLSLAPTIATPPAEVAQHISDAAAIYLLDRNLLESVAWRESSFRQGAKSRVGASGVMQLMPGTARDLGVNRNDTRQNIFGGAAYLKSLLVQFGGDVSLALAAYNAGPGNVRRYGGVPPFAETQNYVAAITGRVAQLAARAVSPSVSVLASN